MAWRRHRRPVAGVRHAPSLCAAPPPAAREALGRSRRRRGANLRGQRSPGSPAERAAGGAPRGWGWGREEEARTPRRAAGAGPGGAWRGGASDAEARQEDPPVGVGGQLPGPRAAGRGVTTVEGGGGGALAAPGCLEVNLAPFPLNVNQITSPFPSLPRR